ncbi:MAG TPA: Clp protease ClpS [Flavobacteriales bacterium]|jgi:ATP-dependent Clp protease adaptor protein ClpS|nr:Clp protease ClpS [Flavobacteriales bacterium]
MQFLFATKYQEKPQEEILGEVGEERVLILHNDEYNTFDFVIDCLIEICNHSPSQAEQCTMIVHYKGKCDVMHGEIDFLNSAQKELKNRGLTATIE